MDCSDSSLAINQSALSYLDDIDFLWLFHTTEPRIELTPLEIYTLMSHLLIKTLGDLRNYQLYFSGDRGILEAHASHLIQQKLQERMVRNAINPKQQ